MAKEYDYLLKVLLVGDSDVGKTEILSNLEDALDEDCKTKKCYYLLKFSHFTSVSATYKTTIILLDGKRVKLQVCRVMSEWKFSNILARNSGNLLFE
jgi:GTPase SAR1 family protein